MADPGPSAKDLDISEPAPLTEDYKRMLMIALTHPLAAVAGNVATPEGTEPGFWNHVAHSGLVQGTLAAGGMIPGLIDRAGDAMRGIPGVGRILAGPETNSPQEIEAKQAIADFAANHAAQMEGAQQNVIKMTGMPQPVTDWDRVVSSGTRMAANIAAPMGVTKIPGIAGKLLGLVAPNASGWKATVPLGLGLGGASEISNILREGGGTEGSISESPRTSPVPRDSGIESASPVAGVLPPADAQGKPPATQQMPGAGQPPAPFGGKPTAAENEVGVPLDSGGVGVPLAAPTTDAYDPSKVIHTPDFGRSMGISNLTVGETWLGAAAAATVGWLGLRYGGKGLAAVSDVGRGALDTSKAIVKGDFAAIPKIPFTQEGRIAQANAAVAAKPRNMMTGQSVPPVPSPLGVNQEVGAVRAATVDHLDEVARIGDAIYTTPAAKSQWRAELGTVLNDTNHENALRYQAESGIEWRTGKRVQAFDDYKRAVAALDDVKTPQWDRGIYALDELDVRYKYMQQALASKGKLPLNAPGDRRGFTGMTDAELQAAGSIVQRDPELKAVYDLRQAIERDKMRALRDAGRITQADFLQATKAHHNYLSSFDEGGRIIHTFGARDMTKFSHIDEIKFPVSHLDEQHYYAVYKDINRNSVLRPFTERILQLQRNDPAFPKLLTERRMPADPITGRPGEAAKPGEALTTLTTYGHNGPKYLEINHPGLARALNTNPTQLGVFLNTASMMRRIYQANVTGLGALAFGSKNFIPTQMSRNMTIIAAQRGANAWGGQIDKLFKTRAAAGKPILGMKSYPLMVDPTTPVMIAKRAITDTGMVFTKRLSDALHPLADNYMRQALVGIKGEPWVQAWRNTLDHTYRASSLAERSSEGLVNIGSRGGLDVRDTLSPGAKPWLMGNRRIYTPGDDSVPTLYRSRIGALYVNTRGLAHDVFNALSDAPHAYHFDLNKSNPMLTRQQLVHEVRTVTGDPAVRGASLPARVASAMVPFHNTSIQGVDATLRAFERAPLQVAAGIMFSHSMAALTQIFSAMLVGEWAMNHMANTLSTQQRSGNVVIYHAPGKFSTVSLDPDFAPVYPALLESYSALIGAWQNHMGEPAYDRIVNSLADMFSHHVSNSTIASTQKAVSNMVDVLQVPPSANLGLETASNEGGHPMRAELHFDQIVQNLRDGRSWHDGIVRGAPSEGNVPDQSHADNGVLNAILTNTIAISAKAWIDGIEPAMHASKLEGSGFPGFWSHWTDNYAQSTKEQNPALNMLWMSDNPIPLNTPIAENVQRAMPTIREVMGHTSDLANAGRTSSRGEQIFTPTDEKNTPSDPTMYRMFIVTGNFGNAIAPIMQKIQDLKEVSESARRGQYYATDKRAVMNVQATRIGEQYEKAAAQIDQLNQALTYLAGRRVDVHKAIDWKKGVEQFPPL